MSMKKARLLFPLLLLLLFVIPVTGQVEHAATPEQCRADSDNWSLPGVAVFNANENAFANIPVTVARNPNITAKMLESRIAELEQCVKTDSLQAVRYNQGANGYVIAELMRMSDYMQRHSLKTQFYQEDEEGKR
jgi:hypothetical protein